LKNFIYTGISSNLELKLAELKETMDLIDDVVTRKLLEELDLSFHNDFLVTKIPKLDEK